MAHHIDKKLQAVIDDIKACIKLGTLGKKAYYAQFQTAIELYLKNFNRFNGNVTPLKEILQPLGKQRPLMVDYIKQVSNIKSLFVDKKTGKLSLKVDGDFTLNDSFNTLKWYEKEEKADKQPIVLNDDSFIKSLLSIFNRYNKESVNITDKDLKLKKLNNLIKAVK